MAASRVKKTDHYRARMVMTGGRIRKARESLGLTQTEFVERARLDKSLAWLSDIERGANSLDPHDLYALARASGYPVEWFLDQDYEKRPHRAPGTRIDWLGMYADREQAEAHWQIDEIFRRIIERAETQQIED